MAVVSRSTSIPSPEPDVVVGRAIVSGQARSLGRGVDEKLKYNPTFDDVHVGYLSINGQTLQINTSRDTLAGVIARLDAFRGLSASLDRHSGLVTIVADRPGVTLEIADDSGFFEALGLQTGTVEATVAVRPSRPNPTAVAAAVAVGEAVAGINGVLDVIARARDLPRGTGAEVLTAVREQITAVTGATGAGLALTAVSGRDQLVVDGAALSKALANDPRALDRLLSGPQGLPEVVSAVLDRHAPEPAAPRPSVRADRTIVDGRRLLGTRSVIRDPGLQVLLMQRFSPAPSAANRLDVRA